MSTYSSTFKIQSDRRVTFHDVTDQTKEIVDKSGIKNGMVLVYSKHTTCSVMIQEDSHDENFWGNKYLLQDMLNVLEEIIPTCTSEGQYLHPGPKLVEAALKIGEELPWVLNTDGHLRSMLMGRSELIPIIDGKVELGEFGRIYFADFDQIRARERIVTIQIIGE